MNKPGLSHSPCPCVGVARASKRKLACSGLAAWVSSFVLGWAAWIDCVVLVREILAALSLPSSILSHHLELKGSLVPFKMVSITF